ncbi:hypothetical protein [Streptomyces sp. NPDC023588]|uniref:hypothetical protein n=1 Tax=Streptomyces sp. NPDC023588 TaxID=3154907 RepID=UPI0033C1A48F
MPKPGECINSIDLHESGRGFDSASAGAVLMDNSTYFSARDLLQSGQVDAYRVYNLANLVESIVVADSIILSPTSAWQPSDADSIFIGDGPGRNLLLTNSSDEELGEIFTKSIAAGTRDVTRRSLNRLGYGPQTARPTLQLLRQWQSEAERDPRGFIQQYSGAVYLTDPASRDVVSSISTVTTDRSPPEYHLAQFLLRSNVAYELSSRWAYHPHSHRLDYISRRMRRSNSEALYVGNDLLREAESATDRVLDQQQRVSALRQFGAFKHDSNVPFILSAVLSQCTMPDDVLRVAIEMRNQRSAQNYRRWIREIIDAIDSGDNERQKRADMEFAEAQQFLSREISRLYIPKKGEGSGVVQQIASHVGSLDPSMITGGEDGLKELAAKEALSIASESPRFAAWIGKQRRKRNIVFLLKLTKKRQSINSLNPLLRSVFKSPLAQDQLQTLHDLQDKNRRNVAALSALADLSR